MNEEEFKGFVERIASEDETRLALRSAFRWKDHSIVTDGRMALVVDRAFESLPIAVDGQQTIAARLVDEILPEQSRAEYARFDLDADLLGRAAAAAAQDIAPEMEELRHYVADPDDPDDMDSEDSERYVLTRQTRVIMPNQKRNVIAGYYAGVTADICKGRTASAYASQKDGNRLLYVKGDDWQLVLMPLLIDNRNEHDVGWAFHGTAVADAKTGELVWRRSNDGPCPIDALRFPKESEEVK